MATNLERLRADLTKLTQDGAELELSLLIKVHGIDKIADALDVKGDDRAGLGKNLPSFNSAYEVWYSESIVLIKQLLPDRLQDFRDHFEAPKNRKDVTYTSYRIQDALKGLRVTRPPYDTVIVDHAAAIPHFQQQVAIVQAAAKRFESSLFEIRQLVQADLFDSEIEAARELLKNKFLRAAGALAGVVLEKHLRQVCDDHKLKIVKKNPTINDLNELLKAESVIDVPQWRHISMLGDIRNLCDHNKQQEPTAQQVTDLIDGTDKVLKTIA